MRRLRETEGTPGHRHAASYHESACRRGKAPLHAALMSEMTALRLALIAKERATEDAADDAVQASATADAAEVDVENAIRDLDSELAKLDREEATHGAQAAVFPKGFGAAIDPEGDEQPKIMPDLRVAVKPYLGQATIAGAMAKLEATMTGLGDALDAETKAEEVADTAFAEELAARAAIRQQMESAYGRLRDHYKARPALAEAFFQKESGRRRARKKKEEGAGGGGAPA